MLLCYCESKKNNLSVACSTEMIKVTSAEQTNQLQTFFK